MTRAGLAVALVCLLGIPVGVGALTFVYAKGFSYLSPDPRACVNCHIMNPQYDAWLKSGHRQAAACVDLRHGMDPQKAAVASGHWPLLRYDPRLAREGKNRLQLDSKAPSPPLKSYAYNETRYTMLAHGDPDEAQRLLDLAQADVDARWRYYEYRAAMPNVTGGVHD
jgi:hypothetical protein